MKRILRFLIAAPTFLAAFACAAAALAGQGGRFSDWLDVPNHFAPLWLIGGAVAGLVWLAVLRRGRVIPALSIIAVLAAGLQVVPELLAGAFQEKAEPAGETLKVIQFNVWGRNEQVEETVRWIVAQKPDVLIVQEARRYDFTVAPALSKHFAYRTTCDEPNPDCSTMIFYNRPALAEGGVGGQGEKPFLPGVWARLDGPGGPFTVAGAHYTWPAPPGLQRRQMDKMAAMIAPFERESLIVTGDFNLTPWSFMLRRQDRLFRLERRTRALFSWPAKEVSRFRVKAPFPVLPIDQVYAGAAWRTVGVERGPALGSDHYPVVVTLTRAPREPSPAAR